MGGGASVLGRGEARRIGSEANSARIAVTVASIAGGLEVQGLGKGPPGVLGGMA